MYPLILSNPFGLVSTPESAYDDRQLSDNVWDLQVFLRTSPSAFTPITSLLSYARPSSFLNTVPGLPYRVAPFPITQGLPFPSRRQSQRTGTYIYITV